MRKKNFRGDTLVEILFSVAIFGLVAISSISAMNSGVMKAQASLESTVARTEINSQAEALRFIHNAYASQEHENETYINLWHAITDLAISPDKIPSNTVAKCGEIYDENNANSIFSVNHPGFIINSRLLNSYVENAQNISEQDVVQSALNGNSPLSNIFIQAPLYPRIVYKANNVISGTGTSADSLQENLSQTNYIYTQSAEGIWVIAAYDNPAKATFYDFYIRTCWNAAGDPAPSTINTTIRLYNPDVEVASQQKNTFTLIYRVNGREINQTKIATQDYYTFRIDQGDPGVTTGKQFMGWVQGDADGVMNFSKFYSQNPAKIIEGSNVFSSENSIRISPGKVYLYPVYGNQYTVNYVCNSAVVDDANNCPDQEKYLSRTSRPQYSITEKQPKSASANFKGWSLYENAAVNSLAEIFCKGLSQSCTSSYSFPSNIYTVTFYAVWSGTRYQVIFDANAGGDDVAEMPKTNDYIKAVDSLAWQFTIPKISPTRTGSGECDAYTFLYWSTKPDDTGTTPIGVRYYTGQRPKLSLDSSEPKITLYAIWRNDGGSSFCYDYKIVLNWGQNPSDLDSHLLISGTASSFGTSELYYANRSNFLKSGTTDCKDDAHYCLDLDDTTSYGPETILLKLDPNSTYTYYVNHYSGSGSINSQTEVTIYDRSGKLKTYQAPYLYTEPGNNWYVFEISTDANGKATIK